MRIARTIMVPGALSAGLRAEEEPRAPALIRIFGGILDSAPPDDAPMRPRRTTPTDKENGREVLRRSAETCRIDEADEARLPKILSGKEEWDEDFARRLLHDNRAALELLDEMLRRPRLQFPLPESLAEECARFMDLRTKSEPTLYLRWIE